MGNKMNWFQYWIGHCLMTGWREIGNNFKMWADLMTDNYEDYVLLKDDNPFEECYNWFWYGISADETYPKEFLEYLQHLCNEIDSGKERLISLEEVTEEIKEVLPDEFDSI